MKESNVQLEGVKHLKSVLEKDVLLQLSVCITSPQPSYKRCTCCALIGDHSRYLPCDGVELGQSILIGLKIEGNMSLNKNSFCLEARCHLFVPGPWSDSPQNQLFSVLCEDDMLPVLLGSLDFLRV